MSKMVEVTQEDANNYCRILTALGMEEEGDPVAAVEKLIAAADDDAELAHKAMQERDSYKAGNTTLLKALMYAHEDKDDANVLRVQVLSEAGMLNDGGSCNWGALEARTPKPKTWADAVNECVTDPAERARLLAMQ